MKRILTLAVVLCTSTVLFAQTYTPAFNAASARQYKVVTTIKGKATQEAMGQTIDMPFDLNSSSTVAAKATGKEGTDVASTLDKVVMTMSVMGQDMNYDSEKPADQDGPLGSKFKDYIGKTATFKVDNTGRVIESTVVKPEAGKVEEGGMDITKMMGNISGDLTTGIAPIFGLLPAGTKALAIGQSATDSFSTDGDTKTKKITTFTLVEIKDGKAKFSISGTTSTEGKVDLQGMSMTLISSSKDSGEMLVDAVTGLLIKKELTSETTGNMEIQGMQIPITVKTAIVTEVSPK